MSRSSALLVLAVLMLSTGWALQRMQQAFPWPYPPYGNLITRHTGLQDAAIITAGFRPLAADMAWIQLLQYTGGWILPGEEHVERYPYLKDMTLRVTRIDPYFRRVYLFSAAILGFFNNIKRPEEAIGILEEGVRADPTYWPFRTLIAAIGYKETSQFESMTRLLEDAVADPDCPALTKSILANAYKSHGRKADAIRIWGLILNDPKSDNYHDKARREIAALQ